MRFALFLLVVLAIVGIAMGLPTRVAIEQHEGDLFHMIDAGLRLQAGEIPHLDFMTPLGILSIAPMALFLSLGFAGGKAALLSNLLVAMLITPVLWWVGQTRMEGKMRFFFGASMLILVSALTYGGGSVSTSLSMYYNRWSWAVVFILLVAILWRAPEGEKPYKLGLLTGIGLSLLALTKMTFFIAFAPPIAIMLVVQRRYRVAGIASLVGGIVLIATTLAPHSGCHMRRIFSRLPSTHSAASPAKTCWLFSARHAFWRARRRSWRRLSGFAKQGRNRWACSCFFCCLLLRLPHGKTGETIRNGFFWSGLSWLPNCALSAARASRVSSSQQSLSSLWRRQ